MRAAPRKPVLLLTLLLALALTGPGCSDDAAPEADAAAPDAALPDAALPDAEVTPDAALPDAAVTPDASTDGGVDVPLPGFGDIAGHCGELDDAEWNVASPFLFRNAIDFGSLPFDYAALSTGGQKVWDDGNLGGSSIHSEVFSYEVLYRCELADLLKTEGEVLYLDPGGTKTDLLVSIDARKVGVSVTRAFHFPAGDPLTLSEAETLLQGKLDDVLLSAANADPADAWERSILHVIAYDAQHADTIEVAYAGLDPVTTADTILLVTVTDGEDTYIY